MESFLTLQHLERRQAAHFDSSSSRLQTDTLYGPPAEERT